MALIDMNIKSDDSVPSPSDAVDYDRSPTIYLSDEQCKALGIGSPKAGTSVMVSARAVVRSVSTHADESSKGESETSVTLQLTHMEISAAPSSGGSLY